MQQLEVVLLGTPAAKMLEVIAMATSSPQVCPSIPSRTSIPLAVKSLTTLAPPQVPIAGVTPSSEKSPATVEARASTLTTDPEGTPAKWCKIMPTPLPAKGSDVDSRVSKLPLIVVPELVVLMQALPEGQLSRGLQTLQRLNMCVPAYKQRLHADAHPATLRTVSWVSDVWKRFPKCSFPLQAQAKNTFS